MDIPSYYYTNIIFLVMQIISYISCDTPIMSKYFNTKSPFSINSMSNYAYSSSSQFDHWWADRASRGVNGANRKPDPHIPILLLWSRDEQAIQVRLCQVPWWGSCWYSLSTHLPGTLTYIVKQDRNFATFEEPRKFRACYEKGNPWTFSICILLHIPKTVKP